MLSCRRSWSEVGFRPGRLNRRACLRIEQGNPHAEVPQTVRGAEQEVAAGLGERTQHQPVMLLADLVASGIEALRVLLESPAQSGLLADGPGHGMKLDDPVRVLPPGSPA